MPPFKSLLLSSATTALLGKLFAPEYAPASSWYSTSIMLFLLLSFGWIIYRWLIYPKLFSPLRHLPRAPGRSFFMGQFRQSMKEAGGKSLCRWVEDVPNDGLIRYFDFFNTERIAIVKPKALAEVLVTKSYMFVKPPQLMKGVGRILGIGLLLAEGEEHKIQRKNLMPAFAFRHIKDLYPTFWSKSRELVEALKVHTERVEGAPGTVVQVGEWASRATLDIVGLAGMGRDFGAIKDPDNYLSKTYRKIFSLSKSAELLGVLGFFLPIWVIRALPFKLNGDIEAASRVVKSVCYSLIEEKRNKLHATERSNVDILSVAMESGGFSDDELVNQLMTFLVAGHETIASSLSWAIYLLCKHPDMQTRLREEIAIFLPKVQDVAWIPTSIEIDRLPYLNAICHEALRLIPPVPLTPRVAAIDTTILGHFIPKGTVLILPPWAVNTSRELWGDDAANFNPDRWTGPGRANTGGADSNYSFLTFLHGPRSCIGQNFAMAEFACLLAAWFGTFETELADKDFVAEVKNGITARPNKLEVRLKLIEAREG